MSLFKYLPKKYLDAFMEKGSLRIGTLHEYRQQEKYGPAVGDPREGFQFTAMDLPGGGEIDFSQRSKETDFFRSIFRIPESPGRHLTVRMESGATFRARSESVEMYIYCVSSEYSELVMREFDCDSCLEIVAPDNFFVAISERVREHATFNSLGSVRYVDRKTRYTTPHTVHPAIMKDPEYSYQKEWRAMWTPVAPPKGPLYVDVPPAIAFARVRSC